jgi:selenocysteine lyase/cysteine desulfurase
MPTTTENRLDYNLVQSEFSCLAEDFIYMNNGTEGSMPETVLNAYASYLRRWASNPTTAYELDPILGKRQKRNREILADFLHVGMNNICFTDNTTMALNMVLMGLNWSAEDKVIITDHEHPAVTSPIWILREKKQLSVQVRTFPSAAALRNMDSAALLDHLFPISPKLANTKALCISHVYNTVGVRLPLDQLRQRVDALNIQYLIIDGAQGVGMLDMGQAENQLAHCDFYAAPAHKWLNGPPGTGFLYLKNEQICPPEFVTAPSQKMGAFHCGDDGGSCLPTAEALQVRGCSAIPAFATITNLIHLISQLGGSSAIESHNLSLAEHVRRFIADKAPHALLSPSDASLSSALVSFFPFDWDDPERLFTDKQTAVKVTEDLLKLGLQLRYVPFPTVDFSENCCLQQHDPSTLIDCSGEPVEQYFSLRVSTGVFNTEQDVVTLQQALQTVLTGLAKSNEQRIALEV